MLKKICKQLLPCFFRTSLNSMRYSEPKNFNLLILEEQNKNSIKISTSIFKILFHLLPSVYTTINKTSSKQKPPSKGVFRKRSSGNTQQICRRIPMPKCNFNKVAKKLCWNHTSAWMISCEFAAYFQYTFSQEHLWTAASE